VTNSRRKGKAGELEASHFLSALFGLPCRRGQQYAGGPYSPDVVGIDGLHIEVKRTERLSLYKAIEQAKHDAGPDEVPMVLHRRNRKPWLAIFEADDLISLTANILHLAKNLNNKQEAKGDEQQ
jgi:hypothetical protein